MTYPHGQRDLHPEGFFDATVEKAVWRQTSKGTPELSLWAKTEHGIVFPSLYFSDKAAAGSVEKVQKSLGYTGSNLAELDNGCLVGVEVRLAINHDTYEGKTRAKANILLPRKEQVSDESAAANVSRFNALLDPSLVKKADDDLPF